MTLVYDRWGVQVHQGDCLDVVRELPDESISAVITDPPAAISFMSRSWDSDRGGRERWVEWLAGRMREAHRVLKPGGHALVWALPRTSHWTAWALEDAGLEIRDCIVHHFGSGFPKSLDIGTAIDRMAGAERDITGPRVRVDGKSPGRNGGIMRFGTDKDRELPTVATAPATEAARQWNGWGTALKPASEHWWLCRKPFTSNVAANVLKHGTGALNIGACRVGTNRNVPASHSKTASNIGVVGIGAQRRCAELDPNIGRWPPNAVFSHAALLDPVTGEVIGDACAGGCVEGGETNLRVYGDARGEIAPSSSPEYLLDRLRALLSDLQLSSTGGTVLWPGASEFYRTEDTQSSGVADDVSRLHDVRRALGPIELPGSPACCRSCCDSDGARVRRVLDAAQGGLPSLLDALVAETRQVTELARSPHCQCSDHQSSSDAQRLDGTCVRTPPSSTSVAPHDVSTVVETADCTQDSRPGRLQHVDESGSSRPNSTVSPSGNSETYDHSGCRHATVRLLTFLAFDIASRLVVPNSGVYFRTIKLTIPQCPVADLDRQSGTLTSGGHSGGLTQRPGLRGNTIISELPSREASTGPASRFFPTFRWEAKAPPSERPRVNGRAHETVKPLDLMKWLVRLVTPPGGTILDLFAGTGTTGQAGRAEGFPCILIEDDPQSIDLIRARLDALPKTDAPVDGKPVAESSGDLFELLDGAAS